MVAAGSAGIDVVVVDIDVVADMVNDAIESMVIDDGNTVAGVARTDEMLAEALDQNVNAQPDMSDTVAARFLSLRYDDVEAVVAGCRSVWASDRKEIDHTVSDHMVEVVVGLLGVDEALM